VACPTFGKERAPQSLQELVNEHYLKEIPTDPFMRPTRIVDLGKERSSAKPKLGSPESLRESLRFLSSLVSHPVGFPRFPPIDRKCLLEMGRIRGDL
jgi:hypothetical protein